MTAMCINLFVQRLIWTKPVYSGNGYANDSRLLQQPLVALYRKKPISALDLGDDKHNEAELRASAGELEYESLSDVQEQIVSAMQAHLAPFRAEGKTDRFTPILFFICLLPAPHNPQYLASYLHSPDYNLQKCEPVSSRSSRLPLLTWFAEYWYPATLLLTAGSLRQHHQSCRNFCHVLRLFVLCLHFSLQIFL